jgi:hypothetical protein
MNNEREEISNVSGEKTSKRQWATQAFKDFIDHQERLMEVLDLSRRGIYMTTTAPRLIAAVANVEGIMGEPDVTKKLDNAKSYADFAQREIDNDFPILHSQAVVSLWGALETLTLTVVADWIVNRPEILHKEPWLSLKVKVGEYEKYDTEQKALHLAYSIDQVLSGPMKGGVTRFESLLKTIGLKGGVSKEVRKDLLELQQIRNVIVHKRGKADRKFCEACPWLALIPGAEISVTSQKVEDYYLATHNYVLELIVRTGEYFGKKDMRATFSEEKVDGPLKVM